MDNGQGETHAQHPRGATHSPRAGASVATAEMARLTHDAAYVARRRSRTPRRAAQGGPPPRGRAEAPAASEHSGWPESMARSASAQAKIWSITPCPPRCRLRLLTERGDEKSATRKSATRKKPPRCATPDHQHAGMRARRRSLCVWGATAYIIAPLRTLAGGARPVYATLGGVRGKGAPSEPRGLVVVDRRPAADGGLVAASRPLAKT